MVEGIRLRTDFFIHPNTRALAKLGDSKAVLALFQLFMSCAEFGIDAKKFKELDIHDISSLAEWDGDEKHFVDMCVDSHFLSVDDKGAYEPVNWRRYFKPYEVDCNGAPEEKHS